MGERDTDGCGGAVPVAVPMAVPTAVPVAVPTAVPVGITFVPVAVAGGGTTEVPVKQLGKGQVKQGPCKKGKKGDESFVFIASALLVARLSLYLDPGQERLTGRGDPGMQWQRTVAGFYWPVGMNRSNSAWFQTDLIQVAASYFVDELIREWSRDWQ